MSKVVQPALRVIQIAGARWKGIGIAIFIAMGMMMNSMVGMANW